MVTESGLPKDMFCETHHTLRTKLLKSKRFIFKLKQTTYLILLDIMICTTYTLGYTLEICKLNSSKLFYLKILSLNG